MANNVVDIEQVPPDIDPMEVGVVSNPFPYEFTHPYAGKPQTIPAGKVVKKERTVEKEVEEEDKEGNKKLVTKKVKEQYEEIVPGKKSFPLYVAVHMAKHIAQKLIREENRNRIMAIADTAEREKESAKPIPDYKGKVWNKIKELVESDSKFFGDEEIRKRFIQ